MSGLIARLIEAGTPADLIEEVAMELARAKVAEEAITKRREADKQRQTRHRHVTSRDTTDVTPRVSLDKETPQTPKEIKPFPCVRETRARGYHRLPENWVPTRALPPKTQAKLDQWPPGAADEELAAMHRWAANAKDENGKGRKLDWDKAWVNWIERRHDERYGEANRGNGGRVGGPRPDPTLALVRAATAAQRPSGGDHGEARLALPPGQFG